MSDQLSHPYISTGLTRVLECIVQYTNWHGPFQGIAHNEMRKPRVNSSQGIRWFDQVSNRLLPECEARMVTTTPWYSTLYGHRTCEDSWREATYLCLFKLHTPCNRKCRSEFERRESVLGLLYLCESFTTNPTRPTLRGRSGGGVQAGQFVSDPARQGPLPHRLHFYT
jgi:hypothetical protein